MLGRVFQNAMRKSARAKAFNKFSQMGFKTTPVLNKKLSIGETAVVIEEKIAGISQVVSRYSKICVNMLCRTTSKNLVLLFQSEMVLQECLV